MNCCTFTFSVYYTTVWTLDAFIA